MAISETGLSISPNNPQVAEQHRFALSEHSNELFKKFFYQDAGQSLYHILWMTSQFIRTEEEQSLLEQYLVGRIANDLFNIEHAKRHPELIMLQDTDVIDYVRPYFPHAKEIRFPLELNTLEWLFIPDAIGLRGNKVRLFENTLVKKEDDLIDRLQHKSKLLKDLRKHHKAIFGTAPLIVGLTEDNYQANAEQIRSLSGIDPVAMPFRTEEIILLTDWLFFQYVPAKGYGTIADICQERIGRGNVKDLVSLELRKGITASLQERQWRYILGLADMIRAAAA